MDGSLAGPAFLLTPLVVAAGLAGAPAPSSGPVPGPAPQEAAWAESLELRNDAFLPTGEEAEARVAEGDLAWGEALARPFDPERPAREAIEAFEAWHAALELSAPGDAVPLRPFPPPPSGAGEPLEPRGTEGVEVAILRRLAALSEPARRVFRERFEPLAEQALGPRPFTWPPSERLERIEREHPSTLPAGRAALALCEVELEAGHPHRARAWLTRADRHAELGGFDDERWSTALDRRRAALRVPASTTTSDGRSPPATEAWTRATELELIETFAYSEVSPGRPPLRAGSRPGAVFLEDGRLVVQTGDAIVTLDPDDPLPLSLLASEIVVELCGFGYQRPRAVTGGEWVCLPATDGRSLVVVAGHGSALLCLRTPEPGVPARVRWALSEDGALLDGERLEPGEALPVAKWDFQPGPVLHEGRVYVQARRWESIDEDTLRRSGKPRAVLLAVELETGRVLWSRLLAIGSDVRTGEEDRQATSDFGLPALPLVEAGERLFAGTQLGVGSLVDGLDGRLAWSFRNRRREPDAPGWNAATVPPPVGPCADGTGPVSLVWAPADSDFLYWMRPEAGLEPDRLLVRPPEPLGAARELFAGTACDVIVAARVGARGALKRWTPDTGARSEALLLRREETFRGSGLASTERVFVTTDRGLYLLDRRRDLYLLQHLPLTSLRSRQRFAGGTVIARGDRIAVVGRSDLWLFRVAR